VRCKILPPDCLGQSTLTILDPGDDALPRLQTTNRLIDQLISVPSTTS
jgi:hypothetical protein